MVFSDVQFQTSQKRQRTINRRVEEEELKKKRRRRWWSGGRVEADDDDDDGDDDDDDEEETRRKTGGLYRATAASRQSGQHPGACVEVDSIEVETGGAKRKISIITGNCAKLRKRISAASSLKSRKICDLACRKSPKFSYGTTHAT